MMVGPSVSAFKSRY